jgi:hypothetical protein
MGSDTTLHYATTLRFSQLTKLPKKSQLPDGRCHPAGEGAYIAGRGGAGAGVMCFLTAGSPGPPAPRAVVFARLKKKAQQKSKN